jgi:hypothetical protein
VGRVVCPVRVVEFYEFDEAGLCVGGASLVREDLVGGWYVAFSNVRLWPLVDERFVLSWRRVSQGGISSFSS